MKVIFFGSSSYSFPVLDSLHKSFQLVGVVTKPKGITKDFALKNSLTYFTPKKKVELLALKEQIISLHPDIGIVSDFGLIIPRDIFKIPKYQTLNIHFSKLPKLRGASPVQFTVFTGEKSAWISIIIMDEGLDTGDIIWQKEIPISGAETAEELYQRLFIIAGKNIADIIAKYTTGQLQPKNQDHSQATYTKLLTRDDGFIPWEIIKSGIKGIKPPKKDLLSWPLYKYLSNQSLITNPEFTILIARASRALYPWPGLWTLLAMKQFNNVTTSKIERIRLKILKIHLVGNKLVLNTVQLEGKKPVTWKQLQEGYPDINY